MTIEAKFLRLATGSAPGQEVRQKTANLAVLLRGEPLRGTPVDFSHGDVDAHAPTPGAFDLFSGGVAAGGSQAYTEYRGDAGVREQVASHLADFTGAPV
ncbi:MAG: pyridoxal phosphate-dependent aminotransferase, partial [Phyllobacterium sp.]